MIENKKFDKKLIKDLNYFSDVNKQLNRINCAKIGIEGILKALK
jgi:NifU-like protein involved in Fe-S cluster formation